MSPALLTSYVNPDLDGVASAIAYGELLRKAGRDVRVGFIGKPQREAEYLLSRLGIKEPEIIENTDGFDSVVLLDASDLNDLEGRIDPGKVTEIIDHRAVNETDKFPNAAADIELVGATATLIAEKFMHGPTAISKESATLLYGAIISNTLNFQGSMTTGRDRRAAAGIGPSIVNVWRYQKACRCLLLSSVPMASNVGFAMSARPGTARSRSRATFSTNPCSFKNPATR